MSGGGWSAAAAQEVTKAGQKCRCGQANHASFAAECSEWRFDDGSGGYYHNDRDAMHGWDVCIKYHDVQQF
jgi:hypothetical protein